MTRALTVPEKKGKNRIRVLCIWLALISVLVAGCAPEKPPGTDGSGVDGKVEWPEPGSEAAPGSIHPLQSVSLEVRQDFLKHIDPVGQGLGSWNELQEPVARSLDYARHKLPFETAAETADGPVTWERLVRTLDLLNRVLPELDARPELLAEMFEWYALKPDALLTGYYEPVLQASLERTKRFSFPLYGPPEDLQTVDLGRFHPRWKGQRLVYRLEQGRIVPYHSRRDIDHSGALAGGQREIAWLQDPVDAFFLQVQGSGRLHFQDGTERHVLYAGKNGLRYVSLGKVLIDRGYLRREEVSMDSIRIFLEEHPELRDELLATNPSYVFFRLDDKGPFGAMGRPLTPMTSLATDPKLLPLGSVLVTDAVLPVKDVPGGERRVILGLAQDIGGAIKNRHLDLFCGAGEGAGYLAGRLQSRAGVYLLLAKEQATSNLP